MNIAPLPPPEARQPDEQSQNEPSQPVVASQGQTEETTSEAPEPESPTPEAPQAPAEEEPEASDVEALIAEAEQRGYLRGRNEQIEMLMKAPSMLENIARSSASAPQQSATSEILILNNVRKSIWEQ